MRAAVMHGRKDIRIEEMPRPVPGPNELLLEVHAAGVCGTDLGEYLEGPSMFPIPGPHPITEHEGPMIPGHEFGGRIVEKGADVDGFAEGELVASGAGISCGTCFQCKTGATNLCVDYVTVGLQRNGSLAQYLTVPASACLGVDNLGLADDAVALVQPMSIAVHAMRRGRPPGDEDVIVIGAGGIGAFLIYALSREINSVVAVDLDEDRLSLAEALGARATVQSDQNAQEKLEAVSPHPRVVYEASGSEAGFRLALRATPPGSRIVVIGIQKTPMTLDLSRTTLEEREIIGTNAHVFATDFPLAAELVAGREEGWSDLAPTALPLEDLVPVAFGEMEDRTSSRIKTLLDPWIEAPRPTRI